MASNSIFDYLSNVAESVKFAAIESIEETMPKTKNLIHSNREAVKELYKDFLDTKQTLPRLNMVQDNTIFKMANKMFNNIKTDIASGQFYHPEREDMMAQMSALSGLMAGMGGMGDDFMAELNAIFSGDFGDEEPGKQDTQLQQEREMVTKGDALVASALFRSQSIATNCIGKAMMQMHEHGTQVQRSISNMQFAQGQKSLMVNQAGWSTMTEGFNRIIDFNNKVTRVHYENSKKFYEDVTETLHESNAIIKSIHAIQKKVYEGQFNNDTAESEDPTRGTDNINFAELFKNGFNLSAYRKMVKQNVQKTPVAMIYNLISALPAMMQQFVDNPLHHFAKTVIDGVVGGQLKYAMQRLDQAIENAFVTGAARLFEYGKNHKDSMLGKIAQVFGFKQEGMKLKDINTSKYEKGAISWNGIAQKALVEVIPTHLARIDAAVTGGKQRHFDFQSGKWIDAEKILQKEKDMRNQTVKTAMKNVKKEHDDITENIVGNMRFDPEKTEKEIERDKAQARRTLNKYSRIVRNASVDYGSMTPEFVDNFRSSAAKKYNLKDAEVDFIIQNYINALDRRTRAEGTRMIGQGLFAENQAKINEVNKGGILSSLASGGIAKNNIVKGNFNKAGEITSPLLNKPLTELEDHRGNTLYDYQYMILERLYNMGGLGSGQGITPTGPASGGGSSQSLLDRFKSNRDERIEANKPKSNPANRANDIGNLGGTINIPLTPEGLSIISTYLAYLVAGRTPDSMVTELDTQKELDDYKWAKSVYDTDPMQVRLKAERYLELQQKKLVAQTKLRRKNGRPITIDSDITHGFDLDTLKKLREKGDDYDWTADEDFMKKAAELSGIHKEILKERRERDVRKQSGFLDIFGSGTRDVTKYHQLPSNVRAEDGILDQLLAANDMGEKMDVIRHNLDALVDSPRVILSSVIGKAEESIYDVLFGRNTGEVDANGKPIHGIFNKMLSETNNAVNNFSDTLKKGMGGFFDEVKKIFGTDEEGNKGILSFIGDFIKDQTDIDVADLANKAKIQAKQLKNKGVKALTRESRAMGKSVFQAFSEAFNTVGLTDDKGKWNFGRKVRDFFTDNGDEDTPGKAKGTRLFGGDKWAILSKGEAVIPPQNNPYAKLAGVTGYGTGTGLIKESGLYPLAPGSQVLNANENPNNFARGKVDLNLQSRQEDSIRSAMKHGLYKFADYTPGYAKGTDLVPKEEMTTRELIELANNGNTDRGNREIAFKMLRARGIDTSSMEERFNVTIDKLFRRLKDTNLSNEEINRIISAPNQQEREKVMAEIFQHHKEAGTFKQKNASEKKMKANMRSIADFAAYGPNTEARFHAMASGIERNDQGEFNISKGYNQKMVDNLINPAKLHKMAYRDIDVLRAALTNLGIGDQIGSNEEIARDKFSAKQGPVTGIRQFLTAMFGSDPKEGAEKTIDYTKDNLGEWAKGGAAGALMSAVLPLGGPFMGALVGAAANTLRKSKSFNDYVFGTEIGKDDKGNTVREDNGLISKKTQAIMEKYLPDMKKYAKVGAVAGLITPFGPLGGAMMGAAASIIKNNASLNRALFGNDKGEGGLLGKNAKQRIKKALPHMGAAMLGTFFLGPFGLLGNAVLGSGIGLLSTSEMFKKTMLGAKGRDGKRRGGIAGAIRRQIVEPFKESMETIKKDLAKWFKDDIFNPVAEGLKPMGRVMQSVVIQGGRAMFDKLSDFLGGNRGLLPKFLTKRFDDLFGGIRKAGGFGKWFTQNTFGKAASWAAGKVKDFGQGFEDQMVRRGYTAGYSAKDFAKVLERNGEQSNRTIVAKNLQNMNTNELEKLVEAMQMMKEHTDGSIGDKIENRQNEELDMLGNDIWQYAELNAKDSADFNHITAWKDRVNDRSFFDNLMKIENLDERKDALEKLVNDSNLSKEARKYILEKVTESFQKYSDWDAAAKASENGTFMSQNKKNMLESLGLREDAMTDQQLAEFINNSGMLDVARNTLEESKDRDHMLAQNRDNKKLQEAAEGTVIVDENVQALGENTEGITKLTSTLDEMIKEMKVFKKVYLGQDLTEEEAKMSGVAETQEEIKAAQNTNNVVVNNFKDLSQKAQETMVGQKKADWDRFLEGEAVPVLAEAIGRAIGKFLGGQVSKPYNNIRDITRAYAEGTTKPTEADKVTGNYENVHAALAMMKDVAATDEEKKLAHDYLNAHVEQMATKFANSGPNAFKGGKNPLDKFDSIKSSLTGKAIDKITGFFGIGEELVRNSKVAKFWEYSDEELRGMDEDVKKNFPDDYDEIHALIEFIIENRPPEKHSLGTALSGLSQAAQRVGKTMYESGKDSFKKESASALDGMKEAAKKTFFGKPKTNAAGTTELTVSGKTIPAMSGSDAAEALQTSGGPVTGGAVNYTTDKEGKETMIVPTGEGDVLTYGKSGTDGSPVLLPTKDNSEVKEKAEKKTKLQEMMANALNAIAEKLGAQVNGEKGEKKKGFLDSLLDLIKSPLSFLGGALSAGAGLIGGWLTKHLFNPLKEGVIKLGKTVFQGLGKVVKAPLLFLKEFAMKNPKLAAILGITSFVGKKIYDGWFKTDEGYQEGVEGYSGVGNGLGNLSPDEQRIAKSWAKAGKSDKEITQQIQFFREQRIARGEEEEVYGSGDMDARKAALSWGLPIGGSLVGSALMKNKALGSGIGGALAGGVAHFAQTGELPGITDMATDAVLGYGMHKLMPGSGGPTINMPTPAPTSAPSNAAGTGWKNKLKTWGKGAWNVLRRNPRLAMLTAAGMGLYNMFGSSNTPKPGTYPEITEDRMTYDPMMIDPNAVGMTNEQKARYQQQMQNNANYDLPPITEPSSTFSPTGMIGSLASMYATNKALGWGWNKLTGKGTEAAASAATKANPAQIKEWLAIANDPNHKMSKWARMMLEKHAGITNIITDPKTGKILTGASKLETAGNLAKFGFNNAMNAIRSSGLGTKLADKAKYAWEAAGNATSKVGTTLTEAGGKLKSFGSSIMSTMEEKIPVIIDKIKSAGDTFLKAISKFVPEAVEGIRTFLGKIFTKLCDPNIIKSILPSVMKRGLLAVATGGVGLLAFQGAFAIKGYFDGKDREEAAKLFEVKPDQVNTPMQTLSGITKGFINFIPFLDLILPLVGGEKYVRDVILATVGPAIGFTVDDLTKVKQAKEDEVSTSTSETPVEGENKSLFEKASDAFKNVGMINPAARLLSNMKDMYDKKKNHDEVIEVLTAKIRDGMHDIRIAINKFLPANAVPALETLAQKLIEEATKESNITKGISVLKKLQSSGTGDDAIPSSLLNAHCERDKVRSAFIKGIGGNSQILKVPAGSATTNMKAIAGILQAVITGLPFLTGFIQEKQIKNIILMTVGNALGVSQSTINEAKNQFEKEQKSSEKMAQNLAQANSEASQGKTNTSTSNSVNANKVTASNSTESTATQDANKANTGVVQTIKDAASSAWNKAKSVASSAWEGAKSAASSVWEGAKSLGSRAYNAVFGKGKMGQGASLDPWSQFNPAYAGIGFNTKQDTQKQTARDSWCGPLATSYGMHKLGLDSNPFNAANYVLSHNGKEKNGGTYPSALQNFAKSKGADSFKVSNMNKAMDTLDKGGVVVTMGKDSNVDKSGEGKTTPYGKNPHYVTVTKNLGNGKVEVHDSETKGKTNKVYNASDVFGHSSEMIGMKNTKGKGSKLNKMKNAFTSLKGKSKSALSSIAKYGRSKFGMAKGGSLDGVTEDEVLKRLMYVAAGLAKKVGSSHPELFFAQLIHETGGPAKYISDNRAAGAGDDHNYGGFTWYEGMGEQFRGVPRPANEGGYYATFDSDDQYIDMAFEKVYKPYQADIAKASNPAEFASVLKANRYYAAPESEYVAGLNGALNSYSSELKNLANIDVSKINTTGSSSGNKPSGTSGSSTGGKSMGLLGEIAEIASYFSSIFGGPSLNNNGSNGKNGGTPASPGGGQGTQVTGGLTGDGNTMHIDAQTGGNCTIEATRAMVKAYLDRDEPKRNEQFGWWNPTLEGDLNGKWVSFGNSAEEKAKFENFISNHFAQKPGNPLFLYQTGGAGRNGSHPINAGQGDHATVIGRKLSNGKYEHYDSAGGVVKEFNLGDIFDPSAEGNPAQGMQPGEGNSLVEPQINPSRPIANWGGPTPTAQMGQGKFSRTGLGKLFSRFGRDKSTPETSPTMWAYLKSKGLSNVAAAGIMGNFQAESSMYSDIVEGGSHSDTCPRNPSIVDDADVPGYGLPQFTWSTLKDGLMSYADSKGQPHSDWKTQIDFLLGDSRSGLDRSTITNMDASQDPYKAALIWHKEYERSADTEDMAARRGEYAKGFFDTEGKGQVDGSSTIGNPATGGVSGGSSSSGGGWLSSLFKKVAAPVSQAMSRLWSAFSSKISQNPAIKKITDFLGIDLFGFGGSSSGGGGSSSVRPGGGGGPIPNAGEVAKRIVEEARSHIGKPYVMGANGPDAYDCSSHAQTSYAAAGIDVPRTADVQHDFFKGKNALVDINQAQPGDMIFFSNTYCDGVSHVGIVTQPGSQDTIQICHASSSKGVIECGLSEWHIEHLTRDEGLPIGSLALAFPETTKSPGSTADKFTPEERKHNAEVVDQGAQITGITPTSTDSGLNVKDTSYQSEDPDDNNLYTDIDTENPQIAGMGKGLLSKFGLGKNPFKFGRGIEDTYLENLHEANTMEEVPKPRNEKWDTSGKFDITDKERKLSQLGLGKYKFGRGFSADPGSADYWINRGYSIDDAMEKAYNHLNGKTNLGTPIEKYNTDEAKANTKPQESQMNTSNSIADMRRQEEEKKKAQTVNLADMRRQEEKKYIAPNGLRITDNDINYLKSNGYTEEQALEVLRKDKKYTEPVTNVEERKKYTAPNGLRYDPNDIKYLTDNGYTEEQAIDILKKEKAYTQPVTEEEIRKSWAKSGASNSIAEAKQSGKAKTKQSGDPTDVNTWLAQGYSMEDAMEKAWEASQGKTIDGKDLKEAKKEQEELEKEHKELSEKQKKIEQVKQDVNKTIEKSKKRNEKLQTTGKGEDVVDEVAPNGEHYTKNDVDYLLSKGYTREDALAFLATIPKYNNKEDNKELEEVAPNGKPYEKNDIEYLLKNGYTRRAAIEFLSKQDKYNKPTKDLEKDQTKKKQSSEVKKYQYKDLKGYDGPDYNKLDIKNDDFGVIQDKLKAQEKWIQENPKEANAKFKEQEFEKEKAEDTKEKEAAIKPTENETNSDIPKIPVQRKSDNISAQILAAQNQTNQLLAQILATIQGAASKVAEPAKQSINTNTKEPDNPVMGTAKAVLSALGGGSSLGIGDKFLPGNKRRGNDQGDILSIIESMNAIANR